MKFCLRFLAGTAIIFLMGCGGGQSLIEELCDNINTCAQSAAQTFSVTACVNEVTIMFEVSDGKGCGSYFDQYVGCLLPLPCKQLLEVQDDYEKPPLECTAKFNTYDKCMGN